MVIPNLFFAEKTIGEFGVDGEWSILDFKDGDSFENILRKFEVAQIQVRQLRLRFGTVEKKSNSQALLLFILYLLLITRYWFGFSINLLLRLGNPVEFNRVLLKLGRTMQKFNSMEGIFQ